MDDDSILEPEQVDEPEQFASPVGAAPIRIDNNLYNIIDNSTGEYVTYSKATNITPTMPITDAKCDGVLIRKAPTGEYFKKSHNGYVNVKWFGAVADYNSTTGTGTDNYNAFVKAINALAPSASSGQRRPCGVLHIPVGDYYIGSTIVVRASIEFLGETINSRLFFASGKDGFIFHASNSPGGTTGGSADGAVLRNLTLIQKTPTTYGNAISARIPLKVFDCVIDTWGGCGIHIPSNAVDPSGYNTVWICMMNDPGANYITTPTATISGDGTGAVITAVLGGQLVGPPSIVDAGDEYWEVPTVTIGTPSRNVTESNIVTIGYGGTALAQMGLGKIVMRSGGQGYTTATATLTTNPGATTIATLGPCTIVGGAITGIPVLTAGLNYTGCPTVNITGDGTGAIPQAYLKVVQFAIQTVGGEYEGASMPLFCRGGRHGTGRDAQGVTNLGNFYVKRLVINNRGVNYTFATCTISGGGGTGAKATVILFKDVQGNSNRSKVRNVSINNCSYGIWTSGSDTNAGLFEQINISFCRLWALHEESFLGNTYIGLICQFNLGAYMMISNTANNNMLLSCYSEGGQLNSVGVNPAKIWGGTHGADVFGTWLFPNQLTLDDLNINHHISLRFGGSPQDGLVSQVWNHVLRSDEPLINTMDTETGDLIVGYEDTSVQVKNIYQITSPYTQNNFGRSTAYDGACSMYIRRLRVGPTITGARALGSLSAIPTSGGFAQGDLYFNNSPVSSSNLFGWLRLTTGSSHVDGTDWLTLNGAGSVSGSYINTGRASYQNADFKLYSSAGGSIISNTSGAAVLNIPNSSLHLINGTATSTYTGLNIYRSGGTSGWHIGSIANGNGFICAGGYRVDGTNWMALETVVSCLQIGASGFTFQCSPAATIGSNTVPPTILQVGTTGKLAVGGTAGTAYVHLPASLTAASSAPLKFTSGVNMTTPEDGAIEYVASHLWFTVGSTRYQLDRQVDTNLFTTDLTLSANRIHTISGTNTIKFNTQSGTSYIRIGDSGDGYPFRCQGTSYFEFGITTNSQILVGTSINTGSFIRCGDYLTATSYIQCGGGFGCNGATVAGAQTGGVKTAAATYAANEQTMLQTVYNAMRTFGFLT